MKKFNRFIVSNNALFGVYDETSEENCFYGVPASQWENEYGEYDAEYISCERIEYSQVELVLSYVEFINSCYHVYPV